VPVRTRDRASGDWVDIDTTLRVDPDGMIRPAATAVELEFTAGGQGPLAVIRDGAHWVEFGWQGELPQPVLDGDTATYSEVLPGVDLVLRAGAEEFSQFLVVKDAIAASSPALAELEFPLRTSQQLAMTDEHVDAAAVLVAVDDAKEPVFAIPQPWMWDSTVAQSSPPNGARPSEEMLDAGPEAQAAAMSVTMSTGSDSLLVVPDQELLTSPDTVYPVVIDPTVSRYQTFWRMFWSNGMTNATTPSGGVNVGYDGWSGQNKRSRLYYRFNTSTFANRTILSARFTHRQVHSPLHSCGGTGSPSVEFGRTGPISSATNWSTMPGGTSSTFTTNNRTHGHRDFCSGFTTVEWNAKAAVQYEASRDNSTLTVRLRSTNESDRNGWREYRHVTDAAPRLQVTYNRAPGKPSGLRTTSPTTSGCAASADRPWVNDNTPVLRATISDPDGDNVRGRFSWQRRNASTGEWGSWTYANTAYGASGSERSHQLPALSDGRYRWRVRGYDATEYGAYSSGPNSSYCYFEVNTSTPPSPTLSIGSPYQFGWWHDPDGLPQATLTVGRAGDTTVDRVRYRIGDGPETTVPITSATRTISFTPTYGVTEVRVRLLNLAGNLGPWVTDDLKIMSPRVQHAWLFNGGTGTSAADVARPAERQRPLSLGVGVDWTTGNLGDLHGEPDDHALWFPGSGAGATTSGPAVFPIASFTVTARVKLDELDPGSKFFVAVSQDGPENSLFKLGYYHNTGTWSAWMHSTGDSSGGWQYLHSPGGPVDLGLEEVPPGPDGNPDWQHLALVYEAPAKKLRLFVDGDLAAEGTHEFTWTSDGPLRIGRGQTGGSLNGTATGKVDDVLLFDGALNAAQVARIRGTDFLADIDVEDVRAAMLDDGLAAGWRLDDGTGTQVQDWTGHGHDLTLAPGAFWVAGRQAGSDPTDGALQFDGTVDAYAESAGPVIDTTQSHTFAAWVRLTGTSTATAGVASQAGVAQGGETASGMLLSYSEAYDAWRFGKRRVDNADYNTVRALGPPARDQWVFLVGVFELGDPSTCLPATRVATCGEYRLYVNGVLQETRAATQPLPAAGPFRLSTYVSPSTEHRHPFRGDLDEVRVYQRVLSPAEIQYLEREER
jgi:hypothetical protein